MVSKAEKKDAKSASFVCKALINHKSLASPRQENYHINITSTPLILDDMNKGIEQKGGLSVWE